MCAIGDRTVAATARREPRNSGDDDNTAQAHGVSDGRREARLRGNVPRSTRSVLLLTTGVEVRTAAQTAVSL